jgi:membrane protease YdiL (CAAX protease family)
MSKPAEEVSGFQIAFLVFAVVVLSIPLAKYSGPWSKEESNVVTRAFIFGTALAVLCGVSRIRHACRRLLAIPIPPSHRAEVAGVTLLHLLTPFALCGGLALEAWFQGGGNALVSRMNEIALKNAPGPGSFSAIVLIMTIPVGWLLAPIIEELLFRGFMFSAWARQFGWFVALILTGVAFAIYHSFFFAAFTASLLYTCLFRRTASLRAPIVVHCIYNALTWYPLMGQFVFRPAGHDASNLLSWWPQLASLAATLVLIPAYVWMARDKNFAQRRATLGTMPLGR